MDDINNEIDSIFESSWSRVIQWMDLYDIVTISASRNRLKDITGNTFIPEGKLVGDSFTIQENKERNKELKSEMLCCGYGITGVLDSYIEGECVTDAIEERVEGSFVVNLKGDADFLDKIFKLSEYYNQDCFLYKAKDDEQAFWVGTNNSANLGYKQKVAVALTSLQSKFMNRIKNVAVNKNKGNERLKAREEWKLKKRNNGIMLETIKDYEPFTRQVIGSFASRIKLEHPYKTLIIK